MVRFGALLSLCLACSTPSDPVESEPSPPPEPPEPVSLDLALQGLVDRHPVPALAALVVVDGQVVAEGAAGLRAADQTAPVTRADRWHLGSCTKAMTATLAAVMVEGGEITWQTTVQSAFPDLEIHDGFKAATLQDLLGNRAGLPTEIPPALWSALWNTSTSPRAHRAQLAEAMLAREPSGLIGTYEYSNAGYMIAGAMLERAADESWEDLIQARVFTPLELSSCGFGPPATTGSLDAPYGHSASGDPVPPGPAADNPPALGPAGTVHCSLRDWARYLAVHVDPDQGGSDLIGAESRARLHTPGAGDYGLGWIIAGHRPWADGVAITHSGSNTMFFATAWVAPEGGTLMITATNAGGTGAVSATNDAILFMLEEHVTD